MGYLNERLRSELVAMAENDLSVREELIADGSLASQGYHPRMEAVHKRNASRLALIIDRYGWPGISLVGEDGARAAWLVAQHAIGNPPSHSPYKSIYFMLPLPGPARKVRALAISSFYRLNLDCSLG